MSKRRRKQKPVWVLVLTDLCLIGVGLVVFALFHHVIPHEEEGEGIVIARTAAGESADRVTEPDGSADEDEDADPDEDEGAYPGEDEFAYPDGDEDAYPDEDGEMYPDGDEDAAPYEDDGAYPDEDGEVYPDGDEDAYPDEDEDAYPDEDEDAYPDEDEGVYPDEEEDVYPDEGGKVYPDEDGDVYPDGDELPEEDTLPEDDGDEPEAPELPVIEGEAEKEAAPEPVKTPGENAAPAGKENAAPAPVGYFGDLYPDHFASDGSVTKTDTSYRSGSLDITLSKTRAYNADVWIVDFYVKDITNFTTAFGKDTYGSGTRYTERCDEICERLGGIIAMNGDYYGARKGATVIRNGVLYKKGTSSKMDVCVLYYDGTMETYAPRQFKVQDAIDNGAWQCWTFGPRLLDEDGQPMTKFNSSVCGKNPRSVVGYFEPGHYCFVLVDGRSKESKGMKMTELSQFMHELGCKRAYNLDGGQTSVLSAMGRVVNDPYKGGRKCSDFLVLMDDRQ